MDEKVVGIVCGVGSVCEGMVTLVMPGRGRVCVPIRKNYYFVDTED